MNKWYCSLSESYHDSEAEAQDVCREYIDPMDYHEHVMDIEPNRIFQALYSPKMAEEVLYEIINNTETYYFKNYITEYENKEEEEMETSNYLYVSHSQMYGMLHGMHTGGCLDNITLEDAKDVAHCCAYDIVTGYDCIMEAIHEDLNEQFGYDETPEEPDEEYLEALEDAIQEECEYSLFEITPEGEAHWDEMEEDYESYEDHLKAGWLKVCE